MCLHMTWIACIEHVFGALLAQFLRLKMKFREKHLLDEPFHSIYAIWDLQIKQTDIIRASNCQYKKVKIFVQKMCAREL